MSWSLFPPKTAELQFDEKWAFVYKKEKNCDRLQATDQYRGDNWDHVAFDPTHRLVLEVVPGKRSSEHVAKVVKAVKGRTGGRMMKLITTDEFSPYKDQILSAYGLLEIVIPTGKRGRPRKPKVLPPPDLLYATVHKTRKNGKVVKVETRLQFGTDQMLERALDNSATSKLINTSYLERQNGTDRHRNSRKGRKTYRFSKDWDSHNSLTFFTLYSYNFCWPVRTLSQKIDHKSYRHRTPAMAAGLADHIWSLQEWITFPAILY